MRSIGGLPTSAMLVAPLAFSPWQATQPFSTNSLAPSAGVPRPGGRLVPSGRMVMSQALMSASLIGLPSFGVSAACAAPSVNASRAAATILRVNMLDLPLGADAPAGDAVVVLVREAGDVRHGLGFAAHRDELRARRLEVAGLVEGAALQHRRSTVPAPGHAKARERLGVHRTLQRRLGPGFAAVGRHQHLGDPPRARISDAGNLVEARLLHVDAERRAGDEGLHLLQEIELIGLAARQDRRVVARLV